MVANYSRNDSKKSRNSRNKRKNVGQVDYQEDAPHLADVLAHVGGVDEEDDEGGGGGCGAHAHPGRKICIEHVDLKFRPLEDVD